MERVQFFNHNNTRILLLDFSNIGTEEVGPVLSSARGMIDVAPPNSLRVLSDFTDANYDKSVVDDIKKFSADNKPHVKASAVVGVTGLKKIVFNAVIKFSGRAMSLFDTREQAKSWLVSQ